MADPQLPLISEEPYTPPPDFEVLFELLQQVTSLAVVSDFLKSKNLTFSAGSWPDLRDKRLLPALQRNQITIGELIALLAQAEEHGRCHAFLYRCTKDVAASILDEKAILAKVKRLGLTDCLGVGKVLNQPSEPTITSIRLENDPRGRVLAVKVIEKRIKHKYLGERVVGKKLIAEWDISEARAVNVVRIFAFGLAEVRIASHESSTRYAGDIQRILKIVDPLIPSANFTDFSVGEAKIQLWTKREEYKKLIKFSNATFGNTTGNTLTATCGAEEGDLLKDKSVSDSLGLFCAAGEAYCESSNIYWLTEEGRLPSKEIHMILPELRNEFAVPANCSKADYEYVFDQLRALSK